MTNNTQTANWFVSEITVFAMAQCETNLSRKVPGINMWRLFGSNFQKLVSGDTLYNTDVTLLSKFVLSAFITLQD